MVSGMILNMQTALIISLVRHIALGQKVLWIIDVMVDGKIMEKDFPMKREFSANG